VGAGVGCVFCRQKSAVERGIAGLVWPRASRRRRLALFGFALALSLALKPRIKSQRFSFSSTVAQCRSVPISAGRKAAGPYLSVAPCRVVSGNVSATEPGRSPGKSYVDGRKGCF
jgi:hypothetical protein